MELAIVMMDSPALFSGKPNVFLPIGSIDWN